MTIRVLLFATLAQKTGERSVTISVPDNATVADALDALSERYADLGPMRRGLATAVNMSYVKSDHFLQPDDELALIPPVSGG